MQPIPAHRQTLGLLPEPGMIPRALTAIAFARGIFAALVLGLGAAQAQTKRCDLVGRDTTVTGVTGKFKRCLDLSALKNATVTVPSNVTRIDNDGLSLCKGSLRLGGDADIVFVLDESGSMEAKFAWINTAVSPQDTLFFYGTGGCSSTATSGTMTYNVFETTHGQAATPTTKTVNLLNSATGCRDWSGDPYNVRAVAVRQAIDSMARTSLISTAGYLGFAGGVRSPVAPLPVSVPANVTTLKNNIYIEFQGATNYSASLRQAKTWLTNPAIIKTPKQAIVFLSDGAPNPPDSNGIALTTDGKMPPIYSIYLAGVATPDTANLKNLSTLTGGQFFRVPPQDPDSVVAIVKTILNLILKEYQPQSAIVSNSTLSPSQSATAAMPAGFTLQGDGSWLMNLSDVIGLNRGVDNAISVKTTFKETNGSSVDTQTINFKIATKGTDATADTTRTAGNPFEWVCYDKSRLVILDSAGQRPAYFTDSNKSVRVRLRTAPTQMDSAIYDERTPLKNDQESIVRKSPSIFRDSLIFDGTNPFLALSGARTNGNGILESGFFDSIIVAWTHPRDPQDAVSDRLPVRVGKQNSAVWFSLTNGGAATDRFPITSTTAYIVVKDQTPDPRKTYTAIVSSATFGIDRETVTLTETFPGSGTMLGSIPFDQLAAKLLGDGKLEVSVGGDQLRVDYKDPVDTADVAWATAGFDQFVQEAPSLQFTDENGAPLPAGTVWSPDKGKLYITYADDYFGGGIPSKKVSLSLASKKYGVTQATDHEAITVNLVASVSGPTRATWTGSIDLADAYPPADSNGKAETRYRGEALISVQTHDNKGNPDPSPISASLLIAYPDSQATVTWRVDSATAGNPVEGLFVSVHDQTYTPKAKDTALVTISCLRTGDSVSAVTALETANASGDYASASQTKDEASPSLSDRNLSCLTADIIRIRYVDPVFGTVTELQVEEAAKPVATPAGRKFTTTETIEIASATPGATIYYTLDGSKPVPGVSPVYSDPIRVSSTTTIKAVAVRNGFKDSKIMTETYTKEIVPSRLEILDENGNTIPSGTLTTAAKGVRIKLVTTQADLPFAAAIAKTRAAGDSERVILGTFGSLGNAFEYYEDIPLSAPTPKVAADLTIQAAGTDTLIAVWTNPFNASDFAADTIVIKPAFVAAEVYFSATQNGPRISEYPVNTDTVFIVVKTRPRDPAFNYTVALTSIDGGIDSETVVLTELSPGVFSGKIKVGTTVAKTKLDNIIEVAAAGDQLTAVFTDPVYKDKYQGDAGFARQVQESAQLDFIDENGNIIAPADVWSPAKGKVYVRFTDDWNANIDSLIREKAVRFSLVNKKSGTAIGADAETLFIALKSHAGSRGTWEGSLVLADKSTAKAGNDTLETYYRGELHAAVTPHDNGGLEILGEAGDDLVIAYPDQPGEIIIRDTSGGIVERKTDKVDIILHDQILTQSGAGSVTATVSCTLSGDRVDKVVLVWDGTQYVAKPPLDKSEVTSGTPNKTDAILSCRENDVLTVVYIDPVYGTPRSAEVRWSDDTPSDLWYASAKDGSRITSATDGTDNEFFIVVKGMSPTRDKVDTIKVTLSVGTDEVETFSAVETGPFTGEFRVKAEYRFLTGGAKSDNGMVEAIIDPTQSVNQAVAKGEAKVGGKTVKADLALLSIFNRAITAWAKDEDGDGRADHLYFRFDHRLPRLPDGLPEAYWNEGTAAFKQKAAASQLAFAKGDSTLLVADFSKSQFGMGLTGIPEGRKAPFAVFPDDNLFGGQSRPLADSVGPIPLTALKLPSDGKTYAVTENERRFNPDTLEITVSEKLRSGASFLELFRFSKGCREYSESVPLKLFGIPEVSADGITFKAIVDNSMESANPLVGDCIFLEGDGRFADLRGNIPSPVGAEIVGKDPNLIIRTFKGYPPVAGIDPGSPGFTTANQDKLEDGTYRVDRGTTTSQVEVIWVPPVGFNSDDPMGSLEKAVKEFNDPQAGDRTADMTHIQPMPTNISTVQVITTTAYLARITIFDNLGNFVRSSVQAFGHNGELRNRFRTQTSGQVSFLVWDMKDSHGVLVGQGVYVWKVNFTFLEANKKSEVRYTRTGVLRQR